MIDKTIDLLKAYLAANHVPPGELPQLIRDVHAAVSVGTGAPSDDYRAGFKLEDTVTDDYIVCLEDGRKMKILKRHLAQVYNLTPEEYRKKWNLPQDYPMVAKSYGTRRSEIAKAQGLGKRS
jgi:predicted transcriptional regulator